MTLQSTNTQSLAANVTNSLLFTHLEKETGWCHEKYIWKFMFAFFSGLFYFVVCSSRSPVDTVGHYGVGWGCGGIGDCSIGRRALFSTLLLSFHPLPCHKNMLSKRCLVGAVMCAHTSANKPALIAVNTPRRNTVSSFGEIQLTVFEKYKNFTKKSKKNHQKMS